MRDDSGQDLLEYGLLVALIALVAVVAVTNSGKGRQQPFLDDRDQVQNAANAPPRRSFTVDAMRRIAVRVTRCNSQCLTHLLWRGRGRNGDGGRRRSADPARAERARR